ncbi:hypothetical protein Gohar_020338 [Gossypium harknessii]|uniref:Uncharacterized protein n=1 Tax=Gossypium harknessii TaxID=34285 RepID=A0A7J9HXB7_9ROSI|nr:hypothetical protein [Gossypium harknessii]
MTYGSPPSTKFPEPITLTS